MLIGLEIWEEFEWDEGNPDSDAPNLLRKVQNAMQSIDWNFSVDPDRNTIYAVIGND
jgi:glucose dehydrogenase